jgi:hypothetical protein
MLLRLADISAFWGVMAVLQADLDGCSGPMV